MFNRDYICISLLHFRDTIAHCWKPCGPRFSHLGFSLSLLPVLVPFHTEGLKWWEGDSEIKRGAGRDKREGEQKLKRQKIQIWRQRESDSYWDTNKRGKPEKKQMEKTKNRKVKTKREPDRGWEQRRSKEEGMMKRKPTRDEEGGSWWDLHFWTLCKCN